MLATCPKDDVRNGSKALESANKACKQTQRKYYTQPGPGSDQPVLRSDPNHPISLETLAAAYAEMGEFGEAVKCQKEAMEHPLFDASRTEAAQNRLKLYEQRKPYRDKNHYGAMPLRKPGL